MPSNSQARPLIYEFSASCQNSPREIFFPSQWPAPQPPKAKP